MLKQIHFLEGNKYMKYRISPLIMNNKKLYYSDNDKLKLRKKTTNDRNAFVF